MPNYSTLKAAIQAAIYENHSNLIEGETLQETLIAMVNSLGADYQFANVAEPNMVPVEPDQNVFYLAFTPGVYYNFGGTVLKSGQVGVFKYNGSWDYVVRTVSVDDISIRNPLAGVDFGNTPAAVQNAISKVWIESTDPTNIEKVITNAPTIYLFAIYNTAGNYRPLVMAGPTYDLNSPAFMWYLASQSSPRTGKEVIRLGCRNPYFTNWGLSYDNAYLCIEIDWSLISGDYTSLWIKIETGKLNVYEVDRVMLSEVGNSVVQNSLFGKKIVCFGDSITEFADTDGKRYSDYLKAITGADIVNLGIGGSMIHARLEPVTTPTTQSQAYAALDIANIVEAIVAGNYTKQINAATWLKNNVGDDNTAIVAQLPNIDWSKVDAVTIFAGTNDWYGGSTIGTSGSVSKSTVLGAINYVIQNLLTAYPHLHIFWFTPIVRWDNYSGGTGVPADFGDNRAAPNTGYTLKAFAELVEGEVKLSHIPVCDMYNTLGWNMWNFANFFPANDGTHPTKPAGMKSIGSRFYSFLMSHNNLQ